MEITPPEESQSDIAPEAVFELLGNEIRMGILRALWEAYDPLSTENAVSFSDLYEAVPVSDSGQFNYHLDKLRGRYVERTEGGYQFRPVGLRLVQSVIAGAGQEGTFEPTDIAVDCRRCGGDTRLIYDGGRVYHVCTDCGGHFESDEYPEGTLWGKSLSPAGVANRSPEELFATLTFLDWPISARLTGNVCPRCSGVLEQSLAVCYDHEHGDEEPCPNCGYSEPIRAHWVCAACKHHATGSISGVVKNHPAVISFLYDHDVDFGYPYSTNEFDTVVENERLKAELTYGQDLVSTDPLRVRVTVEHDGDELVLVLDENLSVLDVTRSDDET
jgi:ribosomal protein L37AE/L43A